MTDPFLVIGRMTVRKSATVLCIRQRKDSQRQIVSKDTWGPGAENHRLLKNLFIGKNGKAMDYEFINGWEILVGQNEVINYLKSTPSKLVTMRYPGEFKLAGGNVDKGETLEDCAKRELGEEFLHPFGLDNGISYDDIQLRLFSVKQTRPIRSRSNLMYNYIALEEENPFLANLDVEAINEQLKARRVSFREKVLSGEYWKMSQQEKELISPEVHKLEWIPLSEMMIRCLSTMVPGVYVNEWQQQQFEALSGGDAKKLRKRDPMFMTAATILEVELLDCASTLKKLSESLTEDDLARKEQWLFDGMTNDDVNIVLKDRLKNGTNPSFLVAELFEQKRKEFQTLYAQNKIDAKL
mmetsp:Transcript_10004/g.13088  ORF Transcript_10004/g.13088 Transcript_10004/m.13088 type:complete len:353 (-) Transcript_10004:52-1110(-)